MTVAAKTLVTIATYNEIENLPPLVDEVFKYAPTVDILVIDDNSPDGTGLWVDRRAGEDRRILPLHRPGKLGLGTATLAGMKHAIEHDYDFVVNMDADFSHHPRFVPDLIAGMERTDATGHIDVMIGSRYVSGGGVEGWPLQRRLMSHAVNFYARALLGLKTKDCSGAFRCYRVSRLRQLDFNRMESLGYSFQEEILWRLKQIGCRFGETPIIFADRTRGHSKINRQEAWNAVRIIGKLGWRNIRGKVA